MPEFPRINGHTNGHKLVLLDVGRDSHGLKARHYARGEHDFETLQNQAAGAGVFLTLLLVNRAV